MPGNYAREEPKTMPPPSTNFIYQKPPRRQWLVVQEFGKEGGVCNDDTAEMEIKNDPYDRY
jgi:hypothetical protein